MFLKNSNKFIATPPGATIEELLIVHDRNREELKEHLNMDESDYLDLLKGELELDNEIAEKLSEFFGEDKTDMKDFWLKLEEDFRDDLDKVMEDNLKLKFKNKRI